MVSDGMSSKSCNGVNDMTGICPPVAPPTRFRRKLDPPLLALVSRWLGRLEMSGLNVFCAWDMPSSCGEVGSGEEGEGGRACMCWVRIDANVVNDACVHRKTSPQKHWPPSSPFIGPLVSCVSRLCVLSRDVPSVHGSCLVEGT